MDNHIYFVEDRYETLIKTTSRMNDHITFVENTYESLKAPLDFVKNQVNYITQ